MRQRLLLLVEDLRQQQAALEHADLLVQGLVALGQGVQLLFGLEVLLGQFVEAVGAAQQVVGELEVGCTFGGQQGTATGFLRFDGLFGNGLLGLGQALLVDQRLQVLDFLFQARGALDQQVVLTVAQVLQQAVAGQFLAAQQGYGIDRRQFGIELVAQVGGQRFTAILAELEAGVDLLGAGLVGADFSLGPLRAGLRGDGQAVGFRQGFLQFALLGGALGQQLFQLRYAQRGIALGDGDHLAVIEFEQLALVLAGLARRIAELLLEGDELFLAVFLGTEEGQGLFEDLLQSLLLGFRQFALGDLVQAVLDGRTGWRFCRPGVGE
ncbi:hypothetical protein D3C77_421220 [compost metagenome]